MGGRGDNRGEVPAGWVTVGTRRVWGSPPTHTWMELPWYLWYSVLALRSSMSMVGSPEMSSSNSCSVKMEMRRFGMIS